MKIRDDGYRWVYCPHCKNKLFAIEGDVENLEIACKSCKAILDLVVEDGRLFYEVRRQPKRGHLPNRYK